MKLRMKCNKPIDTAVAALAVAFRARLGWSLRWVARHQHLNPNTIETRWLFASAVELDGLRAASAVICHRNVRRAAAGAPGWAVEFAGDIQAALEASRFTKLTVRRVRRGDQEPGVGGSALGAGGTRARSGGASRFLGLDGWRAGGAAGFGCGGEFGGCRAERCAFFIPRLGPLPPSTSIKDIPPDQSIRQVRPALSFNAKRAVQDYPLRRQSYSHQILGARSATAPGSSGRPVPRAPSTDYRPGLPGSYMYPLRSA